MLKYVILACLLAAAAPGPAAVTRSLGEIEALRSALSASNKGDGLTLEERMAKNPGSSPWAISGKYQGDIILDEPVIEDMVKKYATGRSGLVDPYQLWPNGTIIYEFALRNFTEAQENYILRVMSFIEQNSCVKFRPRTPSDDAYVWITGAPGGCYASIGYRDSLRVLNLNPSSVLGWGCFNPIVIAHEWLHAFGFFHMHATYNRDDYVQVHWENIIEGRAHEFEKYNSDYVTNLDLPYEYGSCMHYGTHELSSNGQPTISATRPHFGNIGQYNQVTGLDFLRLSRLYNCPEARSTTAFDKAPTTVYVAKEDGTFSEQQIEI